MGIQKTMRFGDYLADGGGQFALNGISGLISAITYFYTDKVGVSALMAANVLLAAKVCDAFTDLIMGKILDNGRVPRASAAPGSCGWPSRPSLPSWRSSPYPRV
jgi:GPH family glycoside/pentoside/hexuronide:cation symporter